MIGERESSIVNFLLSASHRLAKSLACWERHKHFRSNQEKKMTELVVLVRWTEVGSKVINFLAQTN